MNKITYNSNVQFQGKNAILKRNIQERTSRILDQKMSDIVQITKNASPKRMSFLSTLTDCFNQRNFYRPDAEKESSKLVNSVFELVKKPREDHFYIAHKFSRSFDNMKNILLATGDDKKKLAFVRKINENVYGGANPKESNMIINLLKSPLINKYLKNSDSIIPFLSIYKDKPNVVEQLDIKFGSNNYNKDLYRLKLNKHHIKDKYWLKETPILNKNTFYENYNCHTDDFMRVLTKYYNLTDEILEGGADKIILNMLKTLDKKNVGIRKDLLLNFSGGLHRKSLEQKMQGLNALNDIFNKIDNDKHAEKFMKNSVSAMSNCITAEQMDNILNNVSTRKLHSFRKNAWNIIYNTPPEDNVKVLNKHITDLFFQTREYIKVNENRIKLGYKSKMPFYKKMQIVIANSINHAKYLLSTDSKKVANQPEFVPFIKPQVKQETTKAVYEKPSISIQKKKGTEKSAKDIIKENVLAFVTPKLGEKTFARQKDLYGKNATKMRLGMLPEIFASVADTRKADRAVGKKRINSSNKDILDLYLRINGSNKKFVNYMLKKRNVDNTRMFEVKDIIIALDKAERKIAEAKKNNPEYKAKDARKYYNHLYEAKIEQYGKVKTQRKLKTNA